MKYFSVGSLAFSALSILATTENARPSERHPAAERAVEHLNGTCPFVTEALTRAASVREGGIRWSDNGMLELKPSIPVVVEHATQTFTVTAEGLGFRPGRKNARTVVRLELGEEGKLRKLSLEQKTRLPAGSKLSNTTGKGTNAHSISETDKASLSTAASAERSIGSPRHLFVSHARQMR